MSRVSFGARSKQVTIAPCVSEASCSCTSGHVNTDNHVICKCGNDHGEYAGQNTKKPFWR